MPECPYARLVPLRPIGDRDPVNKGVVMKFGIAFPLYDAVTEGGTGSGSGNPGTGSAGATGTGNAGATGTPAGTGQPAGATGTGQGTGTPGQQPAAASGFTYKEDRSDWIPRHRLNEVGNKNRTLEQQLQDANRRIQALAGVTPTDPRDAETEQVRQAFKQMFPHLAKLDDGRIDRLLSLADNSDQITETTKAYWENVGNHMVGQVNSGVAEALGLDELTPTQARRVSQAYVAWLHDDLQDARRRGEAPSLLPRHESRDPKLIGEFVQQFTDDFITPVQRRAVQTNVERVSRRVPSGRAATHTPINSKPKIDFTNEDAVENAAVEAFRAHGGAFRR
jgi:AcrR family transcriptional regulator